MTFRFNVNDELLIKGECYYIVEHPAAPGMPYGQEGRVGIVYCLHLTPTPQPGGHPPWGVGERFALKVFKPRFRLPFLVSQADQLAKYASLPGLRACKRTVLTPTRHPDLLRQYPELIYAVLMPWIEGPTWFDVLIEKKPLSPETSLSLARSLAQVLVRMEEQGIAHCDLSGPNVMLPLLVGGEGVELVDLEGFYGPGMVKPQALSSGSAGYAHKQAVGGLWGPEADRFAGAVLLAEMLGFCDEEVCQLAWGESYFDPAEMQEETNRFRKLIEVLEKRWGGNVAHLFERAWRSDTLLDCPTFGEWLVALPEHPIYHVEQTSSIFAPLAIKGEEEKVTTPTAAEASAKLYAFMQAAQQMEDQNDLDSALKLYRQALELARGDPALCSLAREIELTIQDVQSRASVYRTLQVPMPEVKEITLCPEPAVEHIEQAFSLDTTEEPHPLHKRPWIWALCGLVLLLLALSGVGAVNLPYALTIKQRTRESNQGAITATGWLQPMATPSSFPMPTITESPASISQREATPSPRPTPTQTPKPKPTPTPTSIPTFTPIPPTATPSCPSLPDWPFNEMGSVPKLGCALGPSYSTHFSHQFFEGGEMIYRHDVRGIYVLYYANDTWAYYPDTYVEGEPWQLNQYQPPPGLQQPIKGFDRVWENHPEVRNKIGWAKQGEFGLIKGKVEDFENGVVLWLNQPGYLIKFFILYNNHTWQKR